MTENFYDILGVSKSATDAEIKKQYRLLTKKYHPDIAGDTPENMEMFSKVQKAYEILSDPIQRALYDNPVTMPSSKRGVRIHRKSWRGKTELWILRRISMLPSGPGRVGRTVGKYPRQSEHGRQTSGLSKSVEWGGQRPRIESESALSGSWVGA